MNGSERNDHCTTCGKKLKACKGHEPSSLRRWPFLLLVAIALAVLCTFPFVLHSMGKNDALDTSRPYTFSAGYLHMQDAYFERHQVDHWWLTSSEIAEDQLPAMATKLNVVRENIARILVQYRDTNSATQHIADRFSKLQPSMFTRGASLQLFHGDDVAGALTGLELCFVPENEQHHPSVAPNFAWYRPEWRAIMLYGIELPSGLLAELLYHELWHAFTHQDNSPSATTYDTLIAEEVYAHDSVGVPVLDRATNGAFLELVEKILGRKIGIEEHVGELLEFIRPEDLVALDAMLGIKESGPIIARSVFGDFQLAILFAYAETTNMPVEEKIQAYRWLMQQRQ
ncbi:MAG: hypothetical protein Q7S16_02115 [bacterium]|nr:hypothetical protein [bacterium]